MNIYDKNIKSLKEYRPELYEKVQTSENSAQRVYTGDALDEEKFLAYLNEDGSLIALNSTYHPAHEADRYVAQFSECVPETILFLYGFSDGRVIREILSEHCPINRCIVYEPSVDIFRHALQELELDDLFMDTRLKIIVADPQALEKFLYGEMNYRSWKLFRWAILSKYREIFDTDYKEVQALYKRMYEDRQADMRTLIRAAQAGMVNEAYAMKWMLDSRTLEQLKKRLPTEDVPCIVVAAGPSLEKNVEILKQAKGKAFIICVDTAVKYLLEREIMPDLLCTVDPLKGSSFFTRPEIKEIPIAISADSDYRALESIGDIQPIYISITNDFYRGLFRKQGTDVGYFDGGGSVGTTCFQIGVALGFKTIIIIGQDLAFTDDKAHAGMGNLQESDLVYGLMMVDGYYGEKVLTRGDFKHYLDWYNMRIPEFKDRTIINATEGGAKLKGAIQMSLQAAVDQYCKQEFDFYKVFTETPQVWDTYEKKQEYYEQIQMQYKYFVGFRRKLKEGIRQADRAILLLQRGRYEQRELERIDRELDVITREVSHNDAMVMLVKRMIETDITMTDDLHDAEENLEMESIRLYGKMKKYLSDLNEALEELLPLLRQIAEEINEKYEFEPKTD